MSSFVVLGAATALVVLCLTGRWKLREMPSALPGTAPEAEIARMTR
jgi:hypothetical protein